MIVHGWLYLTAEQHLRIRKQRLEIHAWLEERGLFMEESWGNTPNKPYETMRSKPRIMLFPVDARLCDREAALFEFKMAWL